MTGVTIKLQESMMPRHIFLEEGVIVQKDVVLSLEHFYGCFLFLGVGILVSLGVYVYEIVR